jgi:hypothetical protein
VREDEKDLGPEELAGFAKAMEGALREFASIERQWAASVQRATVHTPWGPVAFSSTGALTPEIIEQAVRVLSGDHPAQTIAWSLPQGPAVWGSPTPPPDENSDADLVATLLDYARSGDEAGFRELAAMRGVAGARLEALWAGAQARVGRAGGAGRCLRCHTRLEHPTLDGHAMPCPGSGGVRRP